MIDAAVAGPAAEPEVDVAVGECQGRALALVDRVETGRRHGAHGPGVAAVGDVERVELVLERARDQAHCVDHAAAGVDHRRARDPDRVDVAAAQLRAPRRRAQVPGPDQGPAALVEGVDGVVLGRGQDHAAEDHRGGVDLAVEGRVPARDGRGDAAERGRAGVVAGAGPVPVVDGPARVGGERRLGDTSGADARHKLPARLAFALASR